MPYKDPINEHVKREVSSINRRFIAHTDMLGSTNAINSRNPSVTPQFQSLTGMGLSGGGKGCASWSQSSANKHYTKSDEPSEKTGGAILGLQDGTLAGDRSKPIQHQTHYNQPETDNTGKFGALGDAFASRLNAAPLGPTASNARSGYAHKDDSPLETQSVAKASSMGLSGNGVSSRKKRISAKAKAAALEGDGFFDDMWSGIKQGVNTVAGVAKPLLGLVPHPAAQAAAAGLGALGYGSPPAAPECCCPRLKSGKAPKRCKCGAGKALKTGGAIPRQVGGSGFAAGTHMDVGSGETYGISSTRPTRGAGRPRKVGGAVLGLVKPPTAGPLDNMPATYGNKSRGPTAIGKRSLDKPTTKADMPSSTLSGLGKTRVGGKRSARADIVKKVMQDRGCTLMQASSIVKKEGLYKP